MELVCPTCHTAVNPGARFCKKCGLRLGEFRAPSAEKTGIAPTQIVDAPASENLAGERKTVTAVFADIKGSTELMADLDPEEARAIIDPALKLMIEAVQRYDGYVVQSTGDGIFALFGAPLAHEDHPQRALYAALRMQEEMRRYSSRLREAGDLPIEARVGVNTGEVVVRTITTGAKTEYTPIGHTANLASRMQALAPTGSIAISENTYKLAGGYFQVRPLGPVEAKGISEPVKIYEVLGPGPLKTHFELAARRGLAKFVGREHELSQMRRALEVAAGGHGQLVAVVAEAGSGKSRLFYEFKSELPANWKILESYSVSHGKSSAWLPVLELLRRYFDLNTADDPPVRRGKVCTALSELDPAFDDTLPYLYSLLGIQDNPDLLAQMDPGIKRQRTIDAIKRICVRESFNQPLLLIFEDLHWIDSETQALLDLLAGSIASSRVLLLLNYRPEYHHEWANKSHYTQLRLDPLQEDDAGTMLSALLGGNGELIQLKGSVIERAGGNPFFIEEIVQSLFDEGALIRDGAVRLTQPLAQLRLPPTVQGMLAARVDRLPPAEKDLLQTLAVIGREAPLSLIERVTAAAEVHLKSMLSALCSAEFVYEQSIRSDTEYVFKHALTQQAAYESLLIERRKRIHERVGRSIEALYATKLDDHLDALVYHYGHSENTDKSIEYLSRAGKQALARSAHDQAIRNLSGAIEQLLTLPDSSKRKMRELSLLMTLGPALIALTGWGTPEVQRSFARARELSAALGDPSELFGVLYGSWGVPFIRAEMAAAHDAALALLAKAELSHDRAMLLMAHAALGMTLFHMGDANRAAHHFRSAIALDDPAHSWMPMGIDLGVNLFSFQAVALWHLGYPDQALESALEAEARARTLAHPHTTAFANGYIAPLRLLRGESAEALEIADHQFALCSQYGLADFLAGAIGVRGTVMAWRGDEGGIPMIERWVASGDKTGLKMVRPSELCSLGEACIAFNRFDKASASLDEALTIAEDDDVRYWEAETNRLRGVLVLKSDPSKNAEAQACFERAIEIARVQKAKSWELRATVSLARLLRAADRRDEARVMLADIYKWFTEGFDTADLRDAKALLEELNA